MSLLEELILPDWLAPKPVVAYTTTRKGGFSQAPYDSLNLGDHVEDERHLVNKNRELLASTVGLTNDQFTWLNQVHGTDVIDASALATTDKVEADGAFTRELDRACVVMTADCLPVLLCDRSGTQVAAVHAGWRGLLNGVIESAVHKFDKPGDVLAWLGPAIGPDHFEVGAEVFDAFVSRDAQAQSAFIKKAPPSTNKYLANLYDLARQRLNKIGVAGVYGGQYCTHRQKDLFYSFRRDGAHTGRLASFIFLSKS